MNYRTAIKPLIDFTLAFLLMVVISPLLCFVIVSLYFFNHKEVFFRQKRPGLHGEIFTILKFKTMNDKKDENGNLLPDYQRMTKIGKFIRSTSIDELPQLFNVLKGDMSMIGPRPLLPDYLNLYSTEQYRRHEVKPGITGWAQVNGRNTLSWYEKFKYDVEYVDSSSFIMDLKIILMTIKNVFQRKDINADQEITMEPFNGYN